MRIKFWITVVMLSIFSACSTDSLTGKNEKQDLESKKEEWINLEINEGGYNLEVPVPTPEIAKGKSISNYSEDNGELNVIAGESFNLILFDDESQMNTVLNQIKNHPFYKVEIVTQTDSTLLYRYYIENNPKEEWQIYAERSIGSPKLIVKSNKDGHFTEFYARKMLESARNIKRLSK